MLRTRSRVLAATLLAVVTAVAGVLLRSPGTHFGQSLQHASYDWSQSFEGGGSLTNSPVVIVYLDLESHRTENQNPLKPWSRALHARLIERLTRAGAKAVVFDIVFEAAGPDAAADKLLAEAMRASGRVILAGEMTPSSHATSQAEGAESLGFVPPAKEFREAAAGWGIANAAVDEDYIVRKIFRGFPDLDQPSLTGAAAKFAGAGGAASGTEWIRYYGEPLAIPHVSYSTALHSEEVSDEFFAGKIVFVGARPMAGLYAERKDEFRSPLASWGDKDLFMPAVEVQATQLLNLLRGDALQRWPAATEAILLIVMAGLLCGVFFSFRPLAGAALAVVIEVAVVGAVMALLHAQKIWFPWLIVGAVQVPAALAGSALFQSLEWYLEKRRFQSRQRVDEAKIREQAALLDKAQDAIVVQDMAGHVTYVNPSAERLYGWNASELAGNGAGAAWLASDEVRRAVLKAGEWLGELHQKTRDGRDLVVDSRCTLIKDGGGNAKSLLFINTDITEKKRIEAEFFRAQRMESVGALAAGMAHDLNNALAPVLMGAQLLQKRSQDEEIRRMLSVMEQNTQRGAEMVRQVLLFSRGRNAEKEPIFLGPLLREMESMIRHAFPKSIGVAALVPPDLWPALGNATQLHQALLNLCVNARDAMPQGGQLTLAADNVVLTAADAKTMPGGAAGSFVMVLVSDTGCGIPPKILERVFEPFFTTKPIGAGTGLGLSTTARIVGQHGGFMQVKSEVDRGTTFEIYLPCAKLEPSPEAGQLSAGGTMCGHGERILIIDDELSVREMMSLALGSHGYEVASAASVAESLSIIERPGTHLALILLDNDMPELTGVEALPLLRSRAPKTRIALMSGEADSVKATTALEVLAKPFQMNQLLAVVAKQLR